MYKKTYEYNNNKKKSLKILIIDDDSENSELLQDYLQLRNHDVDIVDEGSRGICLLHSNKYDLVFIDYHLAKDGSPIYKNKTFLESNMDGIVVSECTNNKKTIMIAYTGDSSYTTINKLKESGMVGILFKPTDLNILNVMMSLLETNLNKDVLYKLPQKNNSVIIF